MPVEWLRMAVDRVPARGRAVGKAGIQLSPIRLGVSLVELADDWLTAKRALESAAQAGKGHSDRACRADLESWAVVLGEVRGRSPTAGQPPIATLVLGDLSEEVLLGAMAAAKRRWYDATVARMLSTLRGFTRWLHRGGYFPPTLSMATSSGSRPGPRRLWQRSDGPLLWRATGSA